MSIHTPTRTSTATLSHTRIPKSQNRPLVILARNGRLVHVSVNSASFLSFGKQQRFSAHRMKACPLPVTRRHPGRRRRHSGEGGSKAAAAGEVAAAQHEEVRRARPPFPPFSSCFWTGALPSRWRRWRARVEHHCLELCVAVAATKTTDEDGGGTRVNTYPGKGILETRSARIWIAECFPTPPQYSVSKGLRR